MKICSLSSGSKGNSIYIGTDKASILVDLGISCRRAEEALLSIGVSPFSIDAILLTHEHGDHMSGVLAFSRKYGCKIYYDIRIAGCIEEEKAKFNAKKIAKGIGFVQNLPFASAHFADDFFIKDLAISPFDVPHDSTSCVGFSFYNEGNKISIATDLGTVTKGILERLKGSDIVLIESNHCEDLLLNGSYPMWLKKRVLGRHGHLSNDSASRLAGELVTYGTRQIILGHVSIENNTPELAYNVTYQALNNMGVKVHDEVGLDVALQNSKTVVFEIK